MNLRLLFIVSLAALLPETVFGEYKPEFNLSTNASENTSWGRAGKRFADAVRYRTNGRIRIKPHFSGAFYNGKQTLEFTLLQNGTEDFSIGSTINWSPQLKELNLFVMPFMFSRFTEVDAVEQGEPGRRLFLLMREKNVMPLAWGENGFREITNSRRPIRSPDDLRGLRIRIPGVPLLVETFQALGADPVSLNWDEAQVAFRNGTVDGQENPMSLIIPYRLFVVHKHITLWHYAIDPLILAVSGKAWATFSAEDRDILQQVANEVMAEQKKEARAGLDETMTLAEVLKNLYEMNVVYLTDDEREAFRARTRPIYEKWAAALGPDLVRTVELLVATTNNQ